MDGDDYIDNDIAVLAIIESAKQCDCKGGQIKPMKIKTNTLLHYVVCTLLLPFVLFIYQYYQNIEYVSLWIMLVMSTVISVLMVIAFFVVRFFAKNNLSAFIFCTVLFAAMSALPSLIPVLLEKPPAVMTILSTITGTLCVFLLTIVLTYNVIKIRSIENLSSVITRRVAGTHLERIISNSKTTPAAILIFIVMFPLLLVTYNIVADRTISIQVQTVLGSSVLLAIALAFLCRKADKFILIPVITMAIFGVVILQNTIGIILFNSQQDTDASSYKDTFFADAYITERPNIYWFHCDGLLGFDAMARFFDDNQEALISELEERSFLISYDAAFEALHRIKSARTKSAVAAFMSPSFYDRVMSWELDPDYAQFISKENNWLKNTGKRISINTSSLSIARGVRNETITSLITAGYNTSTIARYDSIFHPVTHQFYYINIPYETNIVLLDSKSDKKIVDDMLQYINAEETVYLLAGIFFIPDFLYSHINNLFSFPDINELERMSANNTNRLFDDLDISDESMKTLKQYSNIADALQHVFTLPSPRFTIVEFFMAHAPFDYDAEGNYYERGKPPNPADYPGLHTFATNTLLKYVDIILKNDPDAVIMLIADHGIHTIEMKYIQNMFGCSEEEGRALVNQVFMAVRLPKEKITPETHEILSDPRNISRFIINEYVGKNYDYIPAEYRQIFTGPAHGSRQGG